VQDSLILKPKLVRDILFAGFTIIGFAIAMNVYAPLVWIAYIPLFITIIDIQPHERLRKIILVVAIALHPPVAAYWLIGFSKTEYVISSSFFSLVVFCWLLPAIFIKLKEKKPLLQAAILLSGFSACYALLRLINLQFILEFSVYLEWFSLIGAIGSFVLSLLVVTVNVSLALVFSETKRQVRYILIIIALPIGLYFINNALKAGEEKAVASIPLNVYLVQGNYNESWSWRVKHIDEILTQYEDLTEQAIGADTVNVSLTVWPEYALVGELINKKPQYLERLKTLARKANTWIITGTIVNAYDREHYDSALIISPDGQLIDIYHSVYPITFNEHTVSGEKLVTINIGDKRFGIQICYEELMHFMYHDYQDLGVTHMLSLINDMYFDHSPGLHYLLRIAQARAAQHQLPILRSSNTGITSYVSADGQVLAAAPPYMATVLKITL
jgi:apolipoprotein N-acyltransferase